MTGTLRAKFSQMFDNLQGFSICTTCQLLLLQLAHDLMKIPTVEMVSLNTDAVKFYVDEEYKPHTDEVIHSWEKSTGFEMEEDNIVKSVMTNVNNYCEIVQVGDNDYEVHYKGGFFRGQHFFKWNKELKKFQYSFADDVESNSLSICSEALLKNLLFDIPPEKVIMECDDIFRYQKVAHLGHTYKKCVQESENGDIELQRNNRIYAGKIPSGKIVKVKYNGQRDSLADQPPYPIVDNSNQLTIDGIDKQWYIDVAKDWINRFRGVKRLTEYKKDELLKLAEEKGIKVDKKMKKDDIIKILEENNQVEKKEGEKKMNIYEKLNKIKAEIMQHDFMLDQIMPGNLGNKEYASIGQYYKILNEKCIKYDVFFNWSVTEMPYDIKENLFKPTTGKPSHVATVECRAKFINCENTEEDVNIYSMASGSDICDKSVSGASTLAFRNFFDKNFTPKYLNGEEEPTLNDEEKTEQPKIPTFIPETKKEEIKKDVVNDVQHEARDTDDAKLIIDNIMKVREATGNSAWGEATLQSLMNGELSSADILEVELKINTKLESLGI